jgi:hypothetical protein
MEARPPLLIEAIVRRLTPAPCREHVLGDLCEQYTSPLAYVSQAVRTLPYVVVSQIRRTSDAVIVNMEAVMLWAAFRGAARFLQKPLPSDANTWVRLLIPTIVAVVALVITDAYVDPQRRRHPVAESAVAVLAACLAEAALAFIRPDLTAPVRVVLTGGVLAVLLLSIIRSYATRPRLASHAGPRSLDELRQQAGAFETRIRRRNVRESIACLILLPWLAVVFWRGPGPFSRTGAALGVAATIWILSVLKTAGASRPLPPDLGWTASLTFFRRELERQRNLMRTVWWWYLLPVVPSVFVLTIGQTLSTHRLWEGVAAFGGCFIVGTLIGILNQRGALRLQRAIERLDSATESEG